MSKKLAIRLGVVSVVLVAALVSLLAWLSSSFGLFEEDNERGVAEIRKKAATSLNVGEDLVTVEKLVDWPACVTAKAYDTARPDEHLAYKATRVDGTWSVWETAEVQDFDDNYTQSACLDQ